MVSPKSLELILVLGPGDPQLRQYLIEAARAAGSPFKVPTNPGPTWTRFYSTRILTEKEIARLSPDEQQDRIRQFWGQFTSTILPAMISSLQLPGSDGITDLLASSPADASLPEIRSEFDANM
jgi:hypothetical protein